MRCLITLTLFLLCCGTSTAQVVVYEGNQELQVEGDTLKEERLQIEADSTIHQEESIKADVVFDILDSAMNRLPQMQEKLADSLHIPFKQFMKMSLKQKKKLMVDFFGNQIEKLNNIDTTYITPQLFDYAVMLQNTNTFESFTIRGTGDKAQSLRFAPNPTFRLGGYFGWRWLFLGYTFDVGGLAGIKRGNTKKTEIDLSFYTSRLGLDLYYRKTGNDFRITNLDDLFSSENPRPEGLSKDFSGLNLQTRGLNVYYIFNHRYFSYPAAFSQTTVQRKSCGSFKLGLSLTHHQVSFDASKLDTRITPLIDPTMFFSAVKYNDYSINFGYAYNWAFDRDWLFAVSFSPGLSYNVTYYRTGNHDEEIAEGNLNLPTLHNFSLDKLSLDFISRVGLVYNNTRYFAGISFILRSFSYKNKSISFNNSFGSINLYFGFNFKRSKKH